MNDLISEYQQYEAATNEDDEEVDDEDVDEEDVEWFVEGKQGNI